jgi:hypothetical protein
MNIIEATILNGKFKGEDVLLPHIPIILTDMPFEFNFAVFSITHLCIDHINKAPGDNLYYKCVN